MSEARIKELFGEMDRDTLESLFCGHKTVEGFESLPSTFNVVGHTALFVVKHTESGEHYGLVEYNLDSWSEGASTAWEQGYSVYPLQPYEMTVTQYKLGYPVDLEPKKNRW